MSFNELKYELTAKRKLNDYLNHVCIKPYKLRRQNRVSPMGEPSIFNCKICGEFDPTHNSYCDDCNDTIELLISERKSLYLDSTTDHKPLIMRIRRTPAWYVAMLDQRIGGVKISPMI